MPPMTPNIVPIIRYDDPPAAIAWLVRAFGFEKLNEHAVRWGAGVVAVTAHGDSAVHICGSSPQRTLTDPDGFSWSFGHDAMGAGAGDVSIVPEIRYRDLASAARWLEEIGFEKTFEVPGPDGVPAHVEMRFGSGHIFISPLSPEGEFADVTQFANVIVDDPDAHHARAAAAGANIVIAPTDTPFGARCYAARDPENVLWWLGTYRPAQPGLAPKTTRENP